MSAVHVDATLLAWVSLSLAAIALVLAALAIWRTTRTGRPNTGHIQVQPAMNLVTQSRNLLVLPDIAAVATKGFHTPNQDACDAGATAQISVFAVADGLTSTGKLSQIVATAAVQHVVRRVLTQVAVPGNTRAQAQQPKRNLPDAHMRRTDRDIVPAQSDVPFIVSERPNAIEIGDLDMLFAELPQVCHTELDRLGGGVPGTTPRPLSTLLTVISQPQEIILAYVGDGAAMFSTGSLIVMRNVLMPHWDENQRHTRDVGPDSPVTPSVMRIRKNFDEGEILLIGTDGALPQPNPTEVLDFLKFIRDWYIKQKAWEAPPEHVAQAIEQILQEQLIVWQRDDDATLGLLITQKAIEYWRQAASPHIDLEASPVERRPIEVDDGPRG